MSFRASLQASQQGLGEDYSRPVWSRERFGLEQRRKSQRCTLRCQSTRAVDRERRGTTHCFCIKVCVCVMVQNQRARGGGRASVPIKGTAAGDKLTAVIASVCHRIGSETSTIHHRGGEELLSGSSDKGWMKKNDREIGPHPLSITRGGRRPHVRPSNAASAFCSWLVYFHVAPQGIMNQNPGFDFALCVRDVQRRPLTYRSVI